jgi:hypothetical protein
MVNLPNPDTFLSEWRTIMDNDGFVTLKLALAAGATIQANRGTVESPAWVDLDDPQWSCAAHLYRVKPDGAA